MSSNSIVAAKRRPLLFQKHVYGQEQEGKMVGPSRPKFVLFGSSIVQMVNNAGGWSAVLADLYARKVIFFCYILFGTMFEDLEAYFWLWTSLNYFRMMLLFDNIE